MALTICILHIRHYTVHATRRYTIRPTQKRIIAHQTLHNACHNANMVSIIFLFINPCSVKSAHLLTELTMPRQHYCNSMH